MVAAALGSDPQPIGARLVRVGKITGEQLDRGRGAAERGRQPPPRRHPRGAGRDLPPGAGSPAQGPGRGGGVRSAGLDRGLLPLRGREALPGGGRIAGPLPDRGAADGGGPAARRVVPDRLQGVPPRPGAPAAAADQRRRSRSTWCPSSGKCSRRWTASATSTRSPTCWDARSSRWRARSTGSPAAGVVVLDDPARPGGEPEPGRDLAALLVPAREALAQGEYEPRGRRAGGGAARGSADAGSPPAARRLPGGHGPVRRRRSTAGQAWSRLGPRSPGEEAEIPAVERMRRAVETIVKELERYRD